MTLEDLRHEHAVMRIGPLWMAEVRDRCRAVSQTYPPSVYALTGDWGSSLEDLVQQVITDRLLAEGQAEYLVHTSQTLLGFRRLLGRQVRITLAHTRRRTVVDQLLERAAEMLNAAPYQVVETGRRWRVGGAETLERQARPVELRHAANLVRIIPTVRSAGTERAPTVYRSEHLARLIEIVAGSLPTDLKRSDLDWILRDLLTPFLPSVLDGGDAARAGSPDPTPEEEHIVRGAVSEITSGVSAEQAMALAGRLAGASDSLIAETLSVSRPTAIARRREAFDVAKRALEGMAEPLQLHALDELRIALAGTWPTKSTGPDTNQ
jgi:hypothetical protein